MTHPAHTGLLDELLLAWLEEHAGQLEHDVPDPDTARAALLAARGWLPARRFWRRRRELDGPAPEAVWPEGVTVRDDERPLDDRAVHKLITSAFREIGGEAQGQVVRAALSQVTGEDDDFVRRLAVAPSQRGRGLGLRHECFRRHAARGLSATVLGVDAANPTGALDLYTKAGMRVHEQFTRRDRPG